jgi:hypothetical protein
MAGLFSPGIATISARLRVPDLPGPGIGQGHPVKVSGLVAQPWTMGDRSGVAFRAARPGPTDPNEELWGNIQSRTR